jgi:hypothetical protein
MAIADCRLQIDGLAIGDCRLARAIAQANPDVGYVSIGHWAIDNASIVSCTIDNASIGNPAIDDSAIGNRQSPIGNDGWAS